MPNCGVPMNTHLSFDEVKDYVARTMTSEEYAKAGQHVHECRTCYQLLLEALGTRLPIEIDLDELAGLRDWHPADEELIAYFEGRMDELDSDCIGLHLQECVGCRDSFETAMKYRIEQARP